MDHTHNELLRLETSFVGNLVRIAYGSLLTLFGLPVIVNYGILNTIIMAPMVGSDQPCVDSLPTL